MSAFKEEENVTSMPVSFGIETKSRRQRTDFEETSQRKNTWETDDASPENIKTTTNKLVTEDDVIPIIPDLEQVHQEELAITVAQPPSIPLNHIQSIAEIEADLQDSVGIINSYGGVDMSLLAKEALVPSVLIDEKDEIWEWDSVFASIKSDLKKNIS